MGTVIIHRVSSGGSPGVVEETKPEPEEKKQAAISDNPYLNKGKPLQDFTVNRDGMDDLDGEDNEDEQMNRVRKRAERAGSFKLESVEVAQNFTNTGDSEQLKQMVQSPEYADSNSDEDKDDNPYVQKKPSEEETFAIEDDEEDKYDAVDLEASQEFKTKYLASGTDDDKKEEAVTPLEEDKNDSDEDEDYDNYLDKLE